MSQNYCGGIIGIQGLISKTITLNIENCYSIGKVQGKYSGGVVGALTASNSRTTVMTSIKSAYYLSSSASKAINTGSCTEEEIILDYDMSYIKSESFCNILNNNIEGNNNCKTWVLGKDGYPTFE